jgi:hypothetical protein
MRLRFNRTLLFSLVVAFVFVCGAAVGQELSQHHYDKYLTRSQASELDRRFLNMQIEEIQNTLDELEQLNIPTRTGVPSYHLNPKTGKIQILVTVHGNWVDKAPLEEVEQALKAQGQSIIGNLKFNLPEISDSDAFVTFAKINVYKNEIVNDFAEYKSGVLTIRR